MDRPSTYLKPSINSWPIPRGTSCASCRRLESSRKRFYLRASDILLSIMSVPFGDQVRRRQRKPRTSGILPFAIEKKIDPRGTPKLRIFDESLPERFRLLRSRQLNVPRAFLLELTIRERGRGERIRAVYRKLHQRCDSGSARVIIVIASATGRVRSRD